MLLLMGVPRALTDVPAGIGREGAGKREGAGDEGPADEEQGQGGRRRPRSAHVCRLVFHQTVLFFLPPSAGKFPWRR